MSSVETPREVRAQAKYVRMSPRKARLVAEHIRGRSVPEARAVLAFTSREAAGVLQKVLQSAVSNAEANHGIAEDRLYVKATYVDGGPVMKRWRARARGRVARIRKRTCHITVTLVEAPAGGCASGGGGCAGRGRRGTEAEARGREEDDSFRLEEEDRVQASREEEGGRKVMGQKVHPGGMRVGVIHDWKSNWYTGKKDFPAYLIEDIKIREHITNKLSHAGLSDILIRKDKQRITVDIYTARPGIVIGKSGVEVDALRKDLHALTKKNVHININEIKRPELDAKLVAQSIAEQLQNRVSFRRAMKRALASGIRSGAKGVRIQCGGRLGGTEMSRSEAYSEGRVPLHTIRADIDYGFVEAKTTFGRIGVKVWINKGEIMPEGYGGLDTEKDVRLGEQDQARRRRANVEGLGASREGGRDRQRDREGLGPVRPSRKRGGAGRGGAGGGRGGQAGRGGRSAPRSRAGQQDNVEKPRTDEQATSAEGREQPPVEPTVETTPAPVADAPDTTTPKQQTRRPHEAGKGR